MTPQDQWLSQKERILAWFRLGFATIAVLVIQLNPSRVARFPLLSYASLGSFVLYSIALLYIALHRRTALETIGIAATCFDLIWVSLIVFSTGGSATPFFVYYFFPVITAASRYGIKGGISTALAGVALNGYIRFNFEWEGLLGIDRFIVRSIYLLVLAYFFGFLSEFEKKQNQKLLTLTKTAGAVAALVERRRIMQDVHDGLLQSLATQILRLETCRKQLLGAPRELDRELRSIEDDTRNSMKVIRHFLAGKEIQYCPSGMLIEKLKNDLRFLREGLDLQVTLETAPDDDLDLPKAVEQDIYLVLREGLMNVARHSHASHADITLKQTRIEIRGTLSDDGVGFDLAEADNNLGVGLLSMRDRIKKLGGELEIQSSPGRGAKISFSLPLEEKGAGAQNAA
jgi:two-component system sensor histidine kinase DegS